MGRMVGEVVKNYGIKDDIYQQLPRFKHLHGDSTKLLQS